MAMPVSVQDVAVGDWSPNYGTVVEVKENKNAAKVITSYTVKFFSDYSMANLLPDYQLDIVQSGADIMHNGMPDKSQIRPGLAADHGKN